MQLHQLQSTHPRKYAAPPVGRGGKRGNTSGRGQKGQKSRSGHRIRPAERDLILRLPKLRGYNNKPQRDPATIITLFDLAKLSGAIVNRDALVAAKLLRSLAERVKILGGGEVARAMIISGIPVSASAKQAIEKAGGSVKD